MTNCSTALKRKVLLLGYSEKAKHHDVIGQFGNNINTIFSGSFTFIGTVRYTDDFNKLFVESTCGEHIWGHSTAHIPKTLREEMDICCTVPMFPLLLFPL